MNFESLFEAPAVLAKKLELRWVFPPEETPGGKYEGSLEQSYHVGRRPFLRRTLTYIRGERSGDVVAERARKRDVRGSYQHGKAHQPEKLDLLSQVFDHCTNGADPSSLSSSKNATALLGEESVSSESNCRGASGPSNGEKPQKETYESRSAEQNVGEGNAQQNGKKSALNEDGLAMAFGRRFPHYSPFESGEWRPPTKAKDAFALFCASSRVDATKNMTGKEQSVVEKVKEKQKDMWNDLSPTSLLYWKQEAAWDQQRYVREKRTFEELKGDVNFIESNFIRLGQRVRVPTKMKKEKSRKSASQVKHGGAKKARQLKPNAIFFHYLHMGDDNIPATHIEMGEDRRCPLCFFDGCTDAGLLEHCHTTHGDIFTFEGGVDEDEQFHVAVRNNPSSALSSPDHLVDFMFVRVVKDSPVLRDAAQKTSGIDPLGATTKLILTASESSNVNGVSASTTPDDWTPIRQYYHSRTNLPMLEGEWLYDSDDEPDDRWLHKMSEELMEDFEDVSVKEKTFMKMWNRFMKSHTILADRSVPARCTEFISTHLQQLQRSGLRQNLLLHLMNLWDSGVASSSLILSCMALYDASLTKHSSSIADGTGSNIQEGDTVVSNETLSGESGLEGRMDQKSKRKVSPLGLSPLPVKKLKPLEENHAEVS